MKLFKFALAVAVLPLLAACAAGPNIEMTKNMANTGSDFSKALQAEYVVLAMDEAAEWDTEDAVYFNNKAKAAASGEDVQPQEVGERKVSGDAAAELEAARQALRVVLLSGGKDFAPAESARAQAKFDCWLQEQEEGDQQEHIDACRIAFDEALAAAEAKRPAPAPAASAPLAPLPGPFVVFFEFDSFDLTETGAAVVAEAAKAGLAAGASTATVTGHTDTSGASDYNNGLARARAATVGNQLMIEGLPRDMVQRGSAGETFPAVSTGDNVKEARNRRVTISFSR